MSATIDERIVEMRFNNEQFQQNIQESIDSLERLKSELDLQESAKGLNKLSKAGKSFSLASVSESVEGIASKFSTMGIVGVTVLQNLTNSAIAAGKRIVSALTIQPVSTGFSEYELKMNSIKTIMAGSKEDLETVKRYLEELNAYSDQTIYSFSDMTSNIGKFTNAGVKLEDAVLAIKGISNEAALAGANANEASRAMYNFAQAMSSGYVKLIDWKSIELANMATVEFKEELIKTALELKTIKKLENGMYETLTTNALGKTSEAFSETTGFNDSLAYTWMTNDVLVKTLSRYADASTDIGKRATEAATQVRTFTMLMDTLKESAQSGWSTTWEHLVGDLNDATVLFTKLSDIFGGLIQKMNDARNIKLSEWRLLGGRETLFEGIGYLHNTISEIGNIIRDSFREFFPASTGKTLLTFTEKFRDGMKELFKFIHLNKDTIRSVFDGIFSVLKAGISVVKSVARGIKGLLTALVPTGEGFLGLVERLSDYIVDVSQAISDSELLESAITALGKAVEWATNAVKNFATFIKEIFSNADMSGVAETLKNLKENFNPLQTMVTNLTKLMDGLRKAFNWVKEAIGNLGDKVKPVFNEIGTAVKNADLQTLLKTLNLLLTGGLIIGITSLVSRIKKVFRDFGDIFEIFDDLGSLIASYVFNNLAKGLLTVAAALFVISMIPTDKLLPSLGALTGLLVGLIGAIHALNKVFGKEDSVFQTLGQRATALSKLGITIVALGAGLLMAASALKKLSGMAWYDMVGGVVVLAGILFMFMFTMKQLDMTSVSIKTAISLMIITAALSSLVQVMKKLGRFAVEDPEKFFAGYFALAGMLLAIGTFVALVPEKKLLSTSFGILAIGVAINKLSSIMNVLGSMNIQQWAQAVGGLGVLMLTLAITINHMPDSKAALAGAAGIRVIASALKVMSGVMQSLGSMDDGAFTKGLIGAVAGLAALVGALFLIDKIGVGGKVFLGIAAILALALAVRVLVPALVALNDVEWMGILKLVAAMAILLVAGAVAGALVIGLAALAGTILAIGLGCKMAGDGVLDFAKGIEKLAEKGEKGGKALASILSNIIELIPSFAASIGKGIASFATSIAEGSTEIRKALVTVGSDVASASIEVGFNMMISFLNGIRDGAGEAGEAIREALTSILKAVKDNLPQLIDDATQLLVGILDGLADAMEKNNKELRDASIRVGHYVGEGLVIGIEAALETVLSAGTSLSKALVTGVKEGALCNSPSKATIEIGGFVGEGLVIGAKNKSGEVYDTGFGLGETAIEGLRDGADTHSPSRRAISTGEDIGDGLSIGGQNRYASVYQTFEEMGITGVDALDGFKTDFFDMGSSMAESYSSGVEAGFYVQADPLAKARAMIEKDIEDHRRQDLLDPSLLRMRKVMTGMVSETTSALNAIETKTEKTRKEMTTGVGYGINHRLAMGLKLYSEQALKAAEEAKEQTLRPISDMSGKFDFDTSKIESTFAKLRSDTSRLNAELELDNNVTINHTFDKLTIEGVNNNGEFVAAADYSVEKIIASLMRRQSRV